MDVAMQQYQGLEIDVATDATAGSLLGALACLTKSPLTINRDTTKAALDAIKADYTGYAEKVITWQAPSRADDGTIECIGTMAAFRPTDAVAPNDCWALYIHETAAGPLLWACQFPGAPLPMQSALDEISVTFRYRPATNSIAVVVS